MILRETIGLLIVGLALGGGLAYAASRLIDSRLYGVAPQDPLTLLLAVGLLLSVALAPRTSLRKERRNLTRCKPSAASNFGISSPCGEPILAASFHR